MSYVVVQEGYLGSYLGAGADPSWRKHYCRLNSDCTLEFYDSIDAIQAEKTLLLETLWNCIHIGVSIKDRQDCPDVPPEYSQENLMGIYDDPNKKSRMDWYLFRNKEQFSRWKTAIGVTLSRFISNSFLGEFLQPDPSISLPGTVVTSLDKRCSLTLPRKNPEARPLTMESNVYESPRRSVSSSDDPGDTITCSTFTATRTESSLPIYANLMPVHECRESAVEDVYDNIPVETERRLVVSSTDSGTPEMGVDNAAHGRHATMGVAYPSLTEFSDPPPPVNPNYGNSQLSPSAPSISSQDSLLRRRTPPVRRTPDGSRPILPRYSMLYPSLSRGSSPIDRYVMIQNDDSVYHYKIATKEWQLIMKMPVWFDWGSSVAKHDVGLIVVGANHITNGRKSVLANFKIKTHISMPELPQAMRAVSAVYFNSYVYVVGGSKYTGRDWVKSNSVYRLSTDIVSRWEQFSTIPNAVSRPFVFGHEGFLHVYGGITGNSTPVKYTQVLDVAEAKWIQLKPMPVACSSINTGIIMYQGNPILLTGNESMMLDLNASQWNLQTYLGFSFDGMFPVVVTDHNTIVACSHKNGEKMIHEYNCTNNFWEYKNSIDVSACKHPSYFFMCKC